MELYNNSPIKGFVELVDCLGSDGLTTVNEVLRICKN